MNEATTLLSPEVRQVLERLHDRADKNDDEIIQKILDRGYDWKSASAEENAIEFREALLPISPEVGKFLYGIARSISAQNIVEFGTSYGVSTIYLAAALRDNGGGKAIDDGIEYSVKL
jgi:predicted O-methyltransferase YrrM